MDLMWLPHISPLFAINAFDDPVVDGGMSFCGTVRRELWANPVTFPIGALPLDEFVASSHIYTAVTGGGGSSFVSTSSPFYFSLAVRLICNPYRPPRVVRWSFLRQNQVQAALGSQACLGIHFSLHARSFPSR